MDGTVHDISMIRTGRVIGRVVGAWINFKRTHDFESPQLKCCGITQDLFDELNEMEKFLAEHLEELRHKRDQGF